MRSLVVIALCVGFAGSARADSAADAFFEQGKKHLAKKEYAKACAAFEDSFKADPAIGTQANIALCYEKWGKWPEAFRAYSKAARMARDANDDRFSKLRTHSERAGRKIARLAVRIPPDADPRATFMLDGKHVDRAMFSEELVLEPGKHWVEARVGQQVASKEIELEAGDRELVQLEVARSGSKLVEAPKAKVEAPKAKAEPPPKAKVEPPKQEPVKAIESVKPAKPSEPAVEPEPKLEAVPQPAEQAAQIEATPPRKRGRFIGGIALTGAGAAAIGISSYIALGAKSDYNAVEAMCPGGMCTTPEAHATTSEARATARKMTYVFGGGIALVGVGVYLLVTSRGNKPKDSVAATVFVTGESAGVAIGGAL